MKKLFGTDGIRGRVDQYPLTEAAVFTLGQALGVWLKAKCPRVKGALRVVIGKDTRESGESLGLALSSGLNSEELKAISLGMCPTPAIAYLTAALKAQLGIAISASHNPGSDNGIKLFDAAGYKLFPAAEESIEKVFLGLFSENNKSDLNTNSLQDGSAHLRLYTDFAKSSLNNLSLCGLKIVADCAYGSFSQIAPALLQDLGAEVIVLNDTPDGNNINVDCGSLHPQVMAKAVLVSGANIGIAFDGDGDRVIACDEKGNILDGDQMLAILSKHFMRQGKLRGNAVVCTQMTNIGLELYLKGQGIEVIRTDVGDKYVLKEMLERNIVLGAEQSGHIIILGETTTGDGLMAALELIKVMLTTKKPLSRLKENWQRFPQLLVNVKVKRKRPFSEISGLEDQIKRYRQELNGQGRILVRYSGTENLARVMVEGPRQAQVSKIANSLAQIFR